MRKSLCILLVLLLLLSILPAAQADQSGYLSILLIGQDDAAKQTVAVGKQAYGRADAIILVTLNLSTGAIQMLSIDRDYLITLPDQGDTKLCIANYFGGPSLLMEKVNELFGLDVERYAMVGKEDMGKIVGKLGGVEIEIREEDLASTGLRKTGLQKLSQKQVVQYMAGRDVSDETSDVERNERQRIVLNAIIEQTFAAGFEGIVKFAEAVLPLMETNVNIMEIMSVAATLLQRGIQRPEQSRTPLPGDRLVRTIRLHRIVYVEDMEQEITRVQQFLYPE